jgi:hypothetical protein
MSKQEDRLAELKALADQNGGVLQPAVVVEQARNPASALHDAFIWDDTEAARKYRLEQARQLIRVTVEIISDGKQDRTVTAFVAVRQERYEEGGYRHLPSLMKSQEGRQSVLDTALWELRAFEAKYAGLAELAEVFAAVRKVRSRKVA